jgi:hypothetical protein
MWILKGSLLGILMFSILFAFRFHQFFYHTVIDPSPPEVQRTRAFSLPDSAILDGLVWMKSTA